jgi:hypothetical protein
VTLAFSVHLPNVHFHISLYSLPQELRVNDAFLLISYFLLPGILFEFSIILLIAFTFCLVRFAQECPCDLLHQAAETHRSKRRTMMRQLDFFSVYDEYAQVRRPYVQNASLQPQGANHARLIKLTILHFNLPNREIAASEFRKYNCCIASHILATFLLCDQATAVSQ